MAMLGRRSARTCERSTGLHYWPSWSSIDQWRRSHSPCIHQLGTAASDYRFSARGRSDCSTPADAEMSSSGPPAADAANVDDVPTRRRRITYSKEFLLSVARRDNLPAGVNASVLRTMRWHWGFWERRHDATQRSKEVCRSGGDDPRSFHRLTAGGQYDQATAATKMNSLTLGRRTPPVEPADAAATPSTAVKSRLCKSYGTAEGCRWGERCHFAHGEAELGEQMPRRSSFRTKLCVSFAGARSGSCAFGGRCHFAHGEHELRKYKD